MRFFVVASLILMISFGAYAACNPNITSCTPGIPCHACLTFNDPDDPDDGPNKAGEPNALKHTGSNACNADFMNQIVGRAYIEAEREKMMGQIIIRKPDSVMQYTCFEQMVDLTARNAGSSFAEIFTESTYWNGRQVQISAGPAGEESGHIPKSDADASNILYIDQERPVIINTYMGANRMDQAVENVVLESLKAYFENNFSSVLPGGVSNTKPGDNVPENPKSGIPVTLAQTAVVEENNYRCPLMAALYYYTKCEDFGDDDQFFSFDFLAQNGNDPRLYPQACNKKIFINEQNDIDLANNISPYVARDSINEIYRESMMYPPNIFWKGNPKCSAFTPIPTGLMVRYKEFDVQEGTGEVTINQYEAYEEHICPSPSCYYVPDRGNGRGKCEDRKQITP